VWISVGAGLIGAFNSSSHFRFVNLGLTIAQYFTKPGWKCFEEKLRPEWSRELLVRPRWLGSALVPELAETAEQMAKRAHLAEVDRAYQEKRKQNTPWAAAAVNSRLTRPHSRAPRATATIEFEDAQGRIRQAEVPQIALIRHARKREARR
jgi:hypothetical protein